tara:strand:- start:608 stop:1480 length:873 start_codon:yes stop_codon:yes gene_type:complete
LINKFVFLLQESISSLLRTKIPTILSSLAIAVSLLMISISYCIYISFNDLTIQLKDKYTIEVFFIDTIKESNAIKGFNEILLFDGIEEGLFITKSEAAKIFKQEFDEDIMNILGANPLPFSAVYTISEPNRNYNSINSIIKKIEVLEYVDVALYEKESIIKFDRLVRNVITFIFIINLFMMLVVIFFVSNTIMLVIYSKRKDIETYQLLGASNIFIKTPYLIEGVLHGIFGALISVILLYVLYSLTNYFLSPILNMKIYDFIKIISLNFSLGMFLGFLGSSRALSSYVKN